MIGETEILSQGNSEIDKEDFISSHSSLNGFNSIHKVSNETGLSHK